MGPVTEDGERYLVNCWDIVAHTEDGGRWLFPMPENTEEKGEAFAKQVENHGSIDPEKWVDITPNPNALPDYVTDPHNPIFN
jgi:hypothetical protein